MSDSKEPAAPAIVGYAGQRLRQQVMDGADLRGADFARASLDQVSLKGADLRGACLCGADLSQVDLTGAKLDGADLRGASLDRVVLDGASVDELDARGASLAQTSVEGLSGRGLNLSGAQLVKVTLVDATLEDCVLDGASLDDVGFTGTTLRGLSMVGLRATGCALVRCGFDDCDLGGASIEDTELRELTLSASTLRGTLVRSCRVRGLQCDDSPWSGGVIEACRGVGLPLEAQLVTAGATVVHSPVVRGMRALRASRPLQIAVVVGLMLLVLALVVVLRSPGLWPSSVLMSRFEALEGRNDIARCEPLIRVASVLGGRVGVPASQRDRTMQRVAECQLQLGQPEQAVATLRRYVSLSSDQPGEHFAALSLLGRFLLNQGDIVAAEQLLVELRGAAELPEQHIEALRFQASLLGAQGVVASPAHPDEPRPSDDPWRSLQLDMADALIALPALAAHQLGDTPDQLFVLGEWERATQLLTAVVEPPPTPADRWQHVRRAVEQLTSVDRASLALSLLAAQSEGDVLDDLVDVERLQVQVDLHLRLGDAEGALALCDALPPSEDPRLSMEIMLVRAGLFSDAGQPERAQALLEAAVLDADLPFDVLSRHGWLLADARLQGGDEAGAVRALEPVLAAVPDKEPAQNLLRELARWMDQLEDPQQVTALLDRVDNPMLAKAGQGQELALTTLRARARDGAIPLDDPTLEAVLERGTPEQIQEAAQLLLDGAQLDGAVEPAVEALLPHARKLSDTRARENLGLLLVEAAAGASLHGRALELLASMALARSEAIDIRSRAVALEVGITLDRGHLDPAIASYRAAVATPAGMEGWVATNLGRRIVDALQAADRMQEALDLVRELRVDADDQPELWLEAMSCLVSMDDVSGMAAELSAAETAIGSCTARIMATRAWMDQGRTPTQLSALEQACSSAASSVEERLSAASALGQAGDPDGALALVRGAASDALEPQVALRVQRELAAWLAVTGDGDAAIELLEDSYAETTDAEAHQQLTAGLIGLCNASDDPGSVMAAYLRYTGDHPDRLELQLWKQAAFALIHSGHAELVPQLGGQAGWTRHVARDLEQAELRALVDADDIDGAWMLLDRALEGAATADVKNDLLQRAAGLADRSSGHLRLLVWLDDLEAGVGTDAGLLLQLSLRRARALEATGDSAAAVEVLQSLLRQRLPGPIRAEALDSFGHSAGRVHDAATLELDLATIAGIQPLSAEDEQSLRLRAAEELLARGEPGGARALLEPLAGQALEPAVAEAIWDLLARANVAVGRYPDALALPTRFLASAGPCGAWLAVVRHLPTEGPVFEQARDGALHGCSPSEIPVHQALSLADALGKVEPRRALDFLMQVRQAPGLEPLQRANIDVERARLLAEDGQLEQASSLLEGVLADSEQPSVAARAGAQLIHLAAQQGGASASSQVEQVAQQAYDRVQGHPQAAREVAQEAVGALRSLEAWPEAIVWQQRLVDLNPALDEGRGNALLHLIYLQLDTHPGDPSAAGRTWLEQLDEARGLAVPGTHLYEELVTLEVAWRVVQARDEAGILVVLEASLEDVDGDTNFLNSVATRLDAWKKDAAAAVVRREREARLGNP